LEQANTLDALSGVLAPGASFEALQASGEPVSLVVWKAQGDVLEARGGALQAGDLLTARLADAGVVWFLQLLVSEARGVDARLRLSASLPVRSERWMERIPYAAVVRVRRADGAEVDAHLRDVSPLGARLALPGGAELDETLDVRVPGGEADVPLRLRVVRVGHSGDDGVEVAGEVVALAPGDWVRLERLLEAS
jgi:PilZ domain